MSRLAMRRRSLIVLPFAPVLLALAGCGSSAPPFDPKAQYTPEALAEELAFRYERMGPVSRPKPVISRRNREPAGAAEKVETKSQENTKAEKAATIEELVDETVSKAGQIAGSKPEDVLRKVAEIVEKDPKIKEADRRLMAERLLQSR